MAASETLPLRIAAVFIIFVVSILGCLTPYLFIEGRKERDRRKQERAQEEKDEHQQPQGNAAGTNGGRTKPRKKHKDHIESFHTTRAMHLLKAFSAGACVRVCHGAPGPCAPRPVVHPYAVRLYKCLS